MFMTIIISSYLAGHAGNNELHKTTLRESSNMKSTPKPFRPSGTSAEKSPFNNENFEAQSERKHRAGRDIFGIRVMSEQRIRLRQAFSTVNVKQDPGSTPISDQTSPTDSVSEACNSGCMEMTKEDIEALLNTKMKGRNKYDFKGKCEQMMDYIKKLRVCIRHFQELEASHILQQDQLRSQLLEEKRDRRMTEDSLQKRQDELEKDISQLKAICAALEEKLSQAQVEKESLQIAIENEREALKAAEKENAHILEEIVNTRDDCESAKLQVASLQDINKRLQEYNTSLQTYNNKLHKDADVAAETISRIQKEKSALTETLSSLRGHAGALEEQLEQAKVSIRDGIKDRKVLSDEIDRLHLELQHVRGDRDQQAALVETLTAENAWYKECTGKSTAELQALSSKARALEESHSSQSELIKSLRQQLDALNLKLEVAENSIICYKKEGTEQRQKIEDLQKKLSEAELHIHQGDVLRRTLHNTIQELKGNVRVFCRVRPLLPDDDDTAVAELPVVQFPASTDLLGRGIEIIQGQGQKYTFTFDKVFGPEVRQKDVFVEISQLIQSALDGYKVCIFAYGQTGSGKTYTMLGNPDIPEQKGVIPRSLEQIFKSSQALHSQGWIFRMQASMLEIYNESIRDLLFGGRSDCSNSLKQYTIKHDQNGNTTVSDLTLVDVTSWKEVSSLLYRASQSRAVGKTAINEQSSRSHCVFTLRIYGFNEITEERVDGVLNLIDLAGSERLSRSGSTGDRLKETQAINKSLASLGDVILAIGNKEQHIPYRNSKLTYLLQPCLGGDSKTLMFVNISPDMRSANESLCSLRFASKVNACEVGVPRRYTQTRTMDSRLSVG